MKPSTLHRVWDRARAKAGRPDLRFHDLRHTGAVLAALSGATIAELMARLGHTTPTMALRYQHAAQARDVEIAKRLSEIAATT
jgi:integrase